MSGWLQEKWIEEIIKSINKQDEEIERQSEEEWEKKEKNLKEQERIDNLFL